MFLHVYILDPDGKQSPSLTLTQRPLNERNTLTTLFKLFNVEFLYIEKYFDIYTQN